MTRIFFSLLIFCIFQNLTAQNFLSLEEAVTRTLFQQNEIKIAYLNVKNQKGVLQESAGPFDPLFTTVAAENFADGVIRDPITGEKIQDNTKTIMLDSEVSKKTRLGTMFSATAQVFDTFDTIDAFNFEQLLFSFEIDQPLLRGFINGIERQREEANKFELDAVKWDTLFTVSQKVLTTILQYWETTSTYKLVKIYWDSEKRLERVIDLTQKLITGNQLAATDINQVKAQLASQRVIRIAAEQQFVVAKEKLLYDIGDTDTINLKCNNDDLIVNDHFPIPSINDELILCSCEKLMKYALNNRFDIQASIARDQEQIALLKGALNETLPEFNVFGAVYEQKNVTGTYLPHAGPNYVLGSIGGTPGTHQTSWTVGVRLSFPLYNDKALGFFKQQQAKTSQSQLNTQLFRQNVISNLTQIIQGQIHLHHELKSALDAVEKYQITLDNELKKLNAGFSTVFVLLDFEAKLTQALIDLNAIQKSIMQNLANLHFYTGTLIQPYGNLCQLHISDVKNFPRIDEVASNGRY